MSPVISTFQPTKHEDTMLAQNVTAYLLLLVCKTTAAQSQEPVLLGNTKEFRVAISSPASSARVGNALLLRHYSFNAEQKYGRTAHLLVSCDGTWISTTFRDVFHLGEVLTISEQDKSAKTKETPLDPYSIEQTNVSTSLVALADQIARRAGQYCKTASREPKNSFIPVAQTSEENSILTATSLVTGTSAKVDGSIDVWMRSTEYKREDVLDQTGKPLAVNGVIQRSTKPTGKYTMQRVAYDCRRRRMGTYELSVYEAGKTIPDSESMPREKLRLSPVTPGTVGESQLDWVCAIYGTSSN